MYCVILCSLQFVFLFLILDISEWVVKRGVVALVDEQTLWDMHRPLESDCTVQLLNFEEKDPYHVNKAFWRTCALMLGAVVCNAFKTDIPVILHSFPSPNGIYIYFLYTSCKIVYINLLYLLVYTIQLCI